MSKTKNDSFSTVLSVNAYEDKYIIGSANTLKNVTSPGFKKEQYAISYLNTKDSINANIAISRNIADEDVEDAILSAVYDELALDQAIEYQIRHIETFTNTDDDRHFNLFIVDPDILKTDSSGVDEDAKKVFKTAISKVKYLDYVVPSPLLIKSLYAREIVQNDGMHCYIYFEEGDAFIAVYSEKEFLYSKSLNFSLRAMHERFCELYGERVGYDDFIKFLSTQSLKDSTSDYKDFVLKLYKELFSSINDIISWMKRAFEIEKIDQIYIGGSIQTATKLYELAEVELNIKSDDFNFDYGFNSGDGYINPLQAMMQIYATLTPEERYDSNFTSYPRPPKFMKRDSGKLLVASVGALVLAFAYPGAYWGATYFESAHYMLLESEYNELHASKIKREKIIKGKIAERNKHLALMKVQKSEYEEKKDTLIKIHDIKINYPMKAKLLTMFSKDLNKFDVRVDAISYKEDEKTKTFTFSLVANKDKKITKLVENLTKKYDKKYKFAIENIIYKTEFKRYFGTLEVGI